MTKYPSPSSPSFTPSIHPRAGWSPACTFKDSLWATTFIQRSLPPPRSTMSPDGLLSWGRPLGKPLIGICRVPYSTHSPRTHSLVQTPSIIKVARRPGPYKSSVRLGRRRPLWGCACQDMPRIPNEYCVSRALWSPQLGLGKESEWKVNGPFTDQFVYVFLIVEKW